MVVKVYISSVSGNKTIRKQQQEVKNILDGKKIEFESIDISLTGNEALKQFMQENGQPKEGQKYPLPPQIFNDDEYCGDFDLFEMSNEDGALDEFLKLAPATEVSMKTVDLSQNEEECTAAQED